MAGQKAKRGVVGNVSRYITRTQAVKRLQLRLADFRRLCILKGVHPREPKKKFRGQNKTYYHVKDINFLAHEPILQSFRAIQAYQNKVKKARAKKNFQLANKLLKRSPDYKLDHLVKERYPTFVDALRDIDDGLCMVHLFATLPADDDADIPVKMVTLSRRLVLEWQAFCCRTNAIRKAFISVKGFYFQAEVQGQMITWLMPHSISQVLPKDVDYRVMLTFLEFYHTLLQFVHYKLYASLELKYPPVMNSALEKASAELAAIVAQLGGSQQAAIEKRAEVAAMSAEEMRARAATLPEELRAAPAPVAGPAPVMETYADEDSEASDGDDGEGLEIESGDEDSADETTTRDEDPSDAALDAALRMRPAPRDEDDDDEDSVGEEDDEAVRAAGGALTSALSDADVCAQLFKGSVVWLAREVPREPLMLLVRAFGGTACWDGAGSPYTEADAAITHQVVDRPVQTHVHLTREYVQPQWVFDCVNFRILVPVGEYAPGRKPPPHLSPFVDYAEEGYTPDYARDLLKLQDATAAARRRALGEEVTGGEEAFVGDEESDGQPAALAEGAAEELYHTELAKELGTAKPKSVGSKRKHDDEEEELDDSQKQALMTRKNRKMYVGLRKKEAERAARIEGLKTKRDAIEKDRLSRR